MRWLVLLLLVSTAHAQTDNQVLRQTQYDHMFRWSAARWMPEYEWQWLKAQCFQESRLQPRAVSPAGARGICQFMPGTWRDAHRAIGVQNVYSPRENIFAAGWYMRRQLNIWVWRRSDYHRLELAQANYNAGAGNILAAQRACGSPLLWEEIKQCLPQITGHHSAETLGYVRAIKRWKAAQ